MENGIWSYREACWNEENEIYICRDVLQKGTKLFNESLD
jgi:hypothetical protein